MSFFDFAVDLFFSYAFEGAFDEIIDFLFCDILHGVGEVDVEIEFYGKLFFVS